MENTEKGIKMISAVNEASKSKKIFGSEKAMHHTANAISKEKNDDTKLAMIAAASKALEIADKNPSFSDRKIMGLAMDEFPSIISNLKNSSD